ncbi:tetratricopeptide repeat protein, partial [Myxococcota bacterium]|nr:tetratricopeptide repeat protein [Myxococcota bacterium]
MFSKRLMDNSPLDMQEASLWLKVWLFLYSRPPFALKVIENVAGSSAQDLSRNAFSTEELLLVYFLNNNKVEYDNIIKQGGVTENRLRQSIFTGDLKGDFNGAVKLLSKNDAVETILKMEFVYRGNLNEEAFWATEQALYAGLNEIDFKEAVLFAHAAADKEEFALEQLMGLAEKTNWAKALALRTAIKLAASHGEDVMLMKLYHKLYLAAKSQELKGAVCLRAAQIADFRLHRYREAEEFYRLALEHGARPFVSRRGLFRMLLNRSAYGEIIQLAEDSTDPIIQSGAAFICEYRLRDFQKALDIVAPSDFPTRCSLYVKMKDWDQLHSLYAAPNPPVPSSVAKLMTALMESWKGNFDKALMELDPVGSVSPIMTAFIKTFWKKYQSDYDGLIKESEGLLGCLHEDRILAGVKLTLATWLKDLRPEQSAILIGEYLDTGGHLPSTEDNETTWLDILLLHPSPNAEWFEEIEKDLDGMLESTENNKDWKRLASLLKIKSMVVKNEAAKVECLMRLAKLFEEALGNIEEATSYYTQVLNINSGHKRALDSLARINETNEDWDKYLQVIRLSMEANTDKSIKASLYFKYGSILETQFNKIDEALKYYKLAIDASPTSLPALHGIRDIYVKKEHWKGVLNTLKMEASIWDDPKEKAGIYTQMGEILHEKLEKSEQAEIYFTAAIKLRPDSSGALRALFKLYYNNSDWDKAAEIAGSLTKRALSVGTSEERALFFFERGQVFYHTGDMQEAATSYISSIQLDKNNLNPLHALLNISSRYHNPIEFSNFLGELEEVYEETDIGEAKSLIAIARAQLNQATNNSEQALGLFKSAGEVSPLLIDAVYGEANLLLLMGKDQDCHDRWQVYYELVKNKKEHSDDLLKMAKFYSERLDKPREAMTILRGILQKDPNNHKCLFELASELFSIGQNKESMVTIDRLLTLTKNTPFPEKADFIVLAVLIKFMSGEGRKADTILNTIDITQLTVKQAVTIAYVLTVRKEFGKALNVLRKARETNSGDKELGIFHRGLLSYIAGNPNGAIDELEPIAQKMPAALQVIADISMAHETRQQSLKWLKQLIPTHFDDIRFLEVFEERVPDLDNHKRRIYQVRAIFDPLLLEQVDPIPLLRNNALSSEEFKSAVGVKDPTGP